MTIDLPDFDKLERELLAIAAQITQADLDGLEAGRRSMTIIEFQDKLQTLKALAGQDQDGDTE